MLTLIKEKKAFNQADDLAKKKVVEFSVNQLVPDGFEAKQILSNPNISNDESNETKKAIVNTAIEKAKKYSMESNYLIKPISQNHLNDILVENI